MIEIFLQAPIELQALALFFVAYVTWNLLNG
ncbi:hypothetical protein [uncultured Mediterranean phage uvMED]|nr:hypothetical protein [uncultured Mediterranean phage uvMED]